jgi:hypothetical protein
VPDSTFELWSLKETAERCRVSEDTLYRSDCPYIPKGKRGRLYDPEQVARYFRNRLTHRIDT